MGRIICLKKPKNILALKKTVDEFARTIMENEVNLRDQSCTLENHGGTSLLRIAMISKLKWNLVILIT